MSPEDIDAMATPVYRRRPDGVVTLCDPMEAGPAAVLVTCWGTDPTKANWRDAGLTLALRRRQVRLFGGEA